MRSLKPRAWWLVVGFFLCAGSPQALALSVAIGTNFTGSSFHSGGFFESGFTPPDTMGAVGPNHIVELINGRFAVYNKAGVLQTSSTLDTFWGTRAGVNFAGAFTFDPRILYDPANDRWFAAAVDNPGLANNILVAVSDTNDPTGTWSGFAIDSDTDNSDWADFPMMGMDNQGIYITANMFDLPGGGGGNNGAVLVLPKADLLLAVPTVANATLFEDQAFSLTGWSPQPVVDLDNTNLPAPVVGKDAFVFGHAHV